MRTDIQTSNALHRRTKIGTEVLKAKNGVKALPAVPHKRKEEYLKEVSELGYLKCRPDKLTSQIYATFKNGQYKYLAEYALALYH